ncbi:putative GATA transcription factor 22 [Mercurialis annua]|uniref:putative GATA transcription factor 22 n=1 Tax=Mercurialis annua TaxID=3986 RepID=UPI00215DE6CC|nr:putative GATA transcription factor 22 [Mercurialis annua]
MTPLYDLNKFPTVELQEDQHLQLFLPPHHHASSSSSSLNPTNNFFTSTNFQAHKEYSTKLTGESSHHHDHQVDNYKSEYHSRSSTEDHVTISSSSSFQESTVKHNKIQKLSSSCKRELAEDYDLHESGDGSEKWIPSKMRLMRKMMNCSSEADNNNNKPPMKFTLKLQDLHQQHNNDINSSASCSNNVIRVCSDCSTTTTPLWRSGPRGPKSLCNACGIRQRKARRAMAAATAAAAVESGTVITTEASSSKTVKVVKEKKTAQCKKICKAHDHAPHNQVGQKTKISLKNFAISLSKNSALQRVFPQDVEEAAILLMELSCGFIHS